MPTEDQKLEKIRALLKMVDEGVTQAEFKDFIDSTAEFLVKLKRSNEKEVKNIADEISLAFSTLRTKINSETTKKIGQLSKAEKDLYASVESRLNEIDISLNNKLKDFKDGKNPTIDSVAKELEPFILKNIPVPLPPLHGSPDTGIDIVDKINALPLDEEDMIHASHIKGLKQGGETRIISSHGPLYSLVDVNVSGIQIGQSIKWDGQQWIPYTPGAGGGGTIGAPTFVDNETPTGTIDGVNATFTLSDTPSPTGTLILFLNGQFQTQGVDYTLAGSTITFITPPDALFSGLPFEAFYVTDTGDCTFVSNETPTGALNDVNTTFALAGTPSTASSLLLFLNGELMIQGSDYTLSTSTITFSVAPSSDLSGLPFKAFYRTDSGASINFVDNETPAGLFNDVNTTYTLAHIPVTSNTLKLFLNGQFVMQGTDYTLSGATITFASAPSSGYSGLPFKAFYRY